MSFPVAFSPYIRPNSRSASKERFCKVRSDAEIVNAVLNGDKEAFAVLVKRYERPVRAIALGMFWAITILPQTCRRMPS
jgi:hypothetical protein